MAQPPKKQINRGAWTPEEDRKLAQAIATQGPKQWPTVAAKAGLNRCAKSCRLRWMNYLRPNIKRGNTSDQEEDLIIRLHNLLGNRWSLIAARLPGRTDNEVKNYWNYHLRKRVLKQRASVATTTLEENKCNGQTEQGKEKANGNGIERSGTSTRISSETEPLFDVNDFFDFSNENPCTLEWVTEFLQFGSLE